MMYNAEIRRMRPVPSGFIEIGPSSVFRNLLLPLRGRSRTRAVNLATISIELSLMGLCDSL